MSIPTHIEKLIKNTHNLTWKEEEEICDNLHLIIEKYDRHIVEKLFQELPYVKTYFFRSCKYSKAVSAWEDKYGSVKNMDSMPFF
jgi:hypothetical protein